MLGLIKEKIAEIQELQKEDDRTQSGKFTPEQKQTLASLQEFQGQLQAGQYSFEGDDEEDDVTRPKGQGKTAFVT